MDRLVREANARVVFIVDKNGQLIAGSGDTEQVDTTSLASLTAGNIAANRRITFATRGRPGRVRHYGTGLLMTAMPLVFTVSALSRAMDVTP